MHGDVNGCLSNKRPVAGSSSPFSKKMGRVARRAGWGQLPPPWGRAGWGPLPDPVLSGEPVLGVFIHRLPAIWYNTINAISLFVLKHKLKKSSPK
jgi:hypothetical protein